MPSWLCLYSLCKQQGLDTDSNLYQYTRTKWFHCSNPPPNFNIQLKAWCRYLLILSRGHRVATHGWWECVVFFCSDWLQFAWERATFPLRFPFFQPTRVEFVTRYGFRICNPLFAKVEMHPYPPAGMWPKIIHWWEWTGMLYNQTNHLISFFNFYTNYNVDCTCQVKSYN